MKLSFPSIDQIVASVARIIKRFPFVVLVSLVGTIAAIWFADLPYASQEEYPRLLAVCFVSALGISFFFAMSTFLEQKEWGSLTKYGVKLLGLALLLVYYFVIGDSLFGGPHEIFYRFFLFVLGSHLLVAFSPFLGVNKLDQFWEYNKSLFLRILLSVLYSGVLFVGLSIALLAIDNLLGLDVDGETYFQLFLFLGGIFNTWFFLAGVPEKEAIQTKSIIFPTGLRVFVQYVLIPLVSVYIFILYLYLGKTIIQWELPNGWVSNLVLSFSIAGILSLLLLYPIRNSKEFKWVSFYSKYYYLALIPLIGLLLLSIWIRISEYGVTINRYFVATLGVWLTGIVIYFILSKAKNIKVIPISLCLITLAVSFGPVGAFAVSERSQLGRFEEVLDEYGYLDGDGKAQKSKNKIPFDERKDLSSVTEYIVESHGKDKFRKYFYKGFEQIFIDTSDVKLGSHRISYSILEGFGIKYVSKWQEKEGKSSEYQFTYRVSKGEIFNLKGYDHLLLSVYQGINTNKSKRIGNFEVKYDVDTDSLIISNDSLNHKMVYNIHPIAKTLISAHESGDRIERDSLSHDLMTFEKEDEVWKVKLMIASITGSSSDSLHINYLTTHIFIKEKQ